MKILFLSSDFPHPDRPTRGISNCNLLKAMLHEHDVRVVAPRFRSDQSSAQPRAEHQGQLETAVCAGGISAQYPIWNDVRATVLRLATSWVPDLLLGCLAHPDGEAAVQISQVLGVPVVLMPGGSDVLLLAHQLQRRPDILQTLRAVDAIVALSRDLAREVDELGINSAKVHVVPPGTETAVDWKASAGELSGVLRPLVLASQDPDQPRWATWGPTPSGGVIIRHSFRRQMIRCCMELLPERLFVTHGLRREKDIYLTFDDGPHPDHTPRLLDELARLGIKATFFVVGRQVLRHPDLIRRMAAEGHAVANHTFLHSDLRLLSAPEAVMGADALRRRLKEILGAEIFLYRPPRGKIRPTQALALWRAGYTIVLWTADARDWACDSAEQVRTWARHHPLCGGDIVLMHDRLPYACAALPDLLDAANARGLRFESMRAPNGLLDSGNKSNAC